ncbi:MAG: deoxyribodipyrimidine photolyase [Chitinophagales bacterium]|nr:deoxyribodipyrimidine photolyase [Chitinophagales bacterium]
MHFPTETSEIQNRISLISPEKYASSRNYVDGSVTYLSPYISRGVISTRDVFDHLQSLDLPWYKIEKLVQELAWRDYWQQIWIAKGEEINSDLRNIQSNVANHEVPKAIIEARTGIEVVDRAINELYETGYMHNHMRMYVASICCNIARSHWLEPAKWLYAHLLDGDLASNQLSWQWVAGAFSNKKYVANQDNINKYFHSDQKNTFLDVDYSEFEALSIPEILHDTAPFELSTPLPAIDLSILSSEKPTLLYNYYNLDPEWHANEDHQRVVLFEPSFFSKNPVKQNCIDFVFKLIKNIPDAKIFIGEFSELLKHIHAEHIVYKEHPSNGHYQGKEEPRDWLSGVTGYYPSFFKFWKKCKKELKP